MVGIRFRRLGQGRTCGGSGNDGQCDSLRVVVSLKFYFRLFGLLRLTFDGWCGPTFPLRTQMVISCPHPGHEKSHRVGSGGKHRHTTPNDWQGEMSAGATEVSDAPHSPHRLRSRYATTSAGESFVSKLNCMGFQMDPPPKFLVVDQRLCLRTGAFR